MSGSVTVPSLPDPCLLLRCNSAADADASEVQTSHRMRCVALLRVVQPSTSCSRPCLSQHKVGRAACERAAVVLQSKHCCTVAAHSSRNSRLRYYMHALHAVALMLPRTQNAALPHGAPSEVPWHAKHQEFRSHAAGAPARCVHRASSLSCHRQSGCKSLAWRTSRRC